MEEKLEEIEKYFDVGAISIQEKAREGRATQGETMPEVEFVNDVRNCIRIILVDEIDKESYNQFSKFTDKSIEIINDEGIKRLINVKVSV